LQEWRKTMATIPGRVYVNHDAQIVIEFDAEAQAKAGMLLGPLILPRGQSLWLSERVAAARAAEREQEAVKE
jgi:hypothetical protein